MQSSTPTLAQVKQAQSLGIIEPELYSAPRLREAINYATARKSAVTRLASLGLEAPDDITPGQIRKLYDDEVARRVEALGLIEGSTFQYTAGSGIVTLRVVSINSTRRKITLVNTAIGRRFTKDFSFLATKVFPELRPASV